MSNEVRSHPVATAQGYFIILYMYSAIGYFSYVLNPAYRQSYAYAGVLILATVLAVTSKAAVGLINRHGHFLAALLFYALMISAQYALSNLSSLANVREAYIEKMQFVVLTVSSLITFALCKDLRLILKALLLVVLLSCAINLVEFFSPEMLPWRMTSVPGRAAGFFVNPNVSAFMIVSPIPLLFGRLQNAKRLFYYAITFAGMFVTFSRGGWALWLAAVFITEVGRKNRKAFRLTANSMVWICLAIIAIVVFVILLSELSSFALTQLSPNLDSNTSTRLRLLSNDTTMSRLELVRQGWNAFLSSPLFGRGVGYTWQWEYGESVHNMLVLMLAEQGLIGIAWLCVFLRILWRYPSPYGWWIVILFLVTGATTHNYFDGPSFGTLIVLYLVLATQIHRDQRAAQLSVPSSRTKAMRSGYA